MPGLPDIVQAELAYWAMLKLPTERAKSAVITGTTEVTSMLRDELGSTQYAPVNSWLTEAIPLPRITVPVGPTRAARRTFGADTPLRPLMTGAGLLFAAVAAAVAAAAGQAPRSSEAARTPLTRRDMFLSFPRS